MAKKEWKFEDTCKQCGKKIHSNFHIERTMGWHTKLYCKNRPAKPADAVKPEPQIEPKPEPKKPVEPKPSKGMEVPMHKKYPKDPEKMKRPVAALPKADAPQEPSAPEVPQ